MKFLHISDLHIGKRLNGFDLLQDQAAVLREIVEIAANEGADAVLVAGDVYNSDAPSGDAMAVFADFAVALSGAGIPLYLIAGNHDSASRIGYMAPLIRSGGVFAAQEFWGSAEKHVLKDQYGDLNLYLLPFIRPAHVRRFFMDSKVKDYASAMKLVLEASGIDPAARNVLVCHQYIEGGINCDSDTAPVGGLDAIPAELFSDFDYVALGHLHGAQYVGRETVRYSGSPLKYSFSEVNHRKSATLVEIRGKGAVSIRKVDLPALHNMRQVRGPYQELINLPYTEDYMRVILTDEDVRPDARLMLTQVFPNMMVFSVDNSKVRQDLEVVELEQVEQKDPLSLFGEFYAYRNNGQQMDAPREKIVRGILEELEGEK